MSAFFAGIVSSQDARADWWRWMSRFLFHGTSSWERKTLELGQWDVGQTFSKYRNITSTIMFMTSN